MGTGHFPDESLKFVADAIRGVPGDLAEVGVYTGALFVRLCGLAAATGRIAHAFDSFVGMAEPGPHDSATYPAGRLSAGGAAAFDAILRQAGCGSYQLHPGFVPTCFDGVGGTFAFGYIDLDHYAPTVAAADWLWPRVAPGGLLAFDDYFPGDGGASRAVDEFLAAHAAGRVWFDNNQVIVRK